MVNENTQNNQYAQEDEIDLKELFIMLIKNKIKIIFITTIITLIAIIYALLKTPIYEAKALIEIGSYKVHNNNNNNNNNNFLLDDVSSLSQKLNLLFIDIPKNDKNRISEISSISVVKKVKNFIEIKAEAISNELAIKEINKVLMYIKSEHQKILDDVNQKRNFEISNINIQINNIRKNQIVLIQDKIKLYEKDLVENTKQLNLINNNLVKIKYDNPALSALKLMEKRDLSKVIIDSNIEIISMKKEIDTLEQINVNNLLQKRDLNQKLLLKHNYKNTQIVGQIIINNHAIKPKRELIVIVAFVTGFILSIFLVFFMNFVSNIKEEK
jgi:LPS O-antigen subunit length determinant protein (WzzB/FepE family)